MQARKKLVQDYCKRRQRNESMIGQDLRYHLVFHSKNIIYCFTPKVASMQWKKELFVLHEDNQTFRNIHNAQFERLNQYCPDKAEQILENYFTFLFVREPFERFLQPTKPHF